MLNTPWKDLTFIGFDTETTGKYPLSAEVCELAAVKWRGGQVIGEFSTLLKPSQPMGEEVIKIHGITNEMVENAPRMSDKIREFHAFIQDGIPVAHHAPFDLGFMAVDFETAGLPLPELPVVCSSLLSRKVISGSQDHRLQTLIPFLGIEQGQAHRALDDAKACLQVALKCMEKLGADKTLGEVMEIQGGPLHWSRFSMKAVGGTEQGAALLRAIREQKIVEAAYAGGSTPGEARRLHPMGFVRSLDGDFLVAYCEKEQRSKRYFLDKITSVKIV